MTDILSRIDDTLTFHSAGLGADLEVPVERDVMEIEDIRMEAGGVYLLRATVTFQSLRPFVVRFRDEVCRAFGVPTELVLSRDEVDRARRLRRMRHLYRMRRVR